MHKLSRRAALRLGLVVALPLVVPPSSFAMDLPLAIKGYDPVAYFTDGRPTPGPPDIEYQWDEHTYRFASMEHRELFKAEPVRYAPQFGNFCAMALAVGRIVVANPENWLISEGKLYVFGSPAPEAPLCSRRILPETSRRQIRTGRCFRRTRTNGRCSCSVSKPALRMPSRRCSRSAVLRNLLPNSRGSNVGSRRRWSRYARRPRLGCARRRRPRARSG